MSKTVLIKNVGLYYPHLARSHSPFGTQIWDVQIRTDDEETKTQLEEAGVKIKKHDEGYYYANVKRNVLNRKGEKNNPPIVVDHNKEPFDPATGIGNGTRANLKLFSYDWEMMGRKGKSAMLQAVQIAELVPYTPTNYVDFDVVATPEIF